VVTGITTHGCIKKDTINVRVRQPFIVQVQPGDTLCAGEQTKLGAAGADKYQWTPAAGLDNTTSATPKASPAATTVYTVIGKDNDNCFADTGSVKLVVYPVPQIFAGNDTVVSTGNTIPLKAKSSADVTKWSWTPASGLSCATCAVTNAVVKGSVTYRVTVSNDGGCTASDDITVAAVCNEGNWFIPNTFSPNGDGVNDIFYVRGKGLNLVHSLRIFNRWGQAIFEKRDFMANDPAVGWDGKVNGKPADMDVYVYILEVVCDNSNNIPIKGNVALVK
jgi:gliding motility-associated-like protein